MPDTRLIISPAMMEAPRPDSKQCRWSASAFLVLYAVTSVVKQTLGQCGTAQVAHEVQRYILSMEALDCRLYTPTVSDYKICTLSTLNCFTEEVMVLSMEMEDKSQRVLALRERLKKLMLNVSGRQKNGTHTRCPPCEIHTEQVAADFLEELKSILQYECSSDYDED